MSMLWILFSLLAPAVWASANIIDKYVLSKLLKEPWVLLVGYGFAGFVASGLIYYFKGFSAISSLGIVLALCTGALYFIAELLYYKATKLEEISRVISLVYLDPIFTAALAAVFLGEVFPAIKYVGVLLLVAGAVLISLKPNKATGMKARAVWFCVISAFFYSLHNLLSKHLLGQADFWTVFSYVRLGSFIATLPIIIFKRKVIWNLIFKETSTFALITFNSFLNLLGVFLFVIALSLGYVALTAALSALQPFFVLMMTLGLGVFYPQILKEEQGKGIFFQKLLAIVLMFVGVVLIT